MLLIWLQSKEADKNCLAHKGQRLATLEVVEPGTMEASETVVDEETPGPDVASKLIVIVGWSEREGVV